MQKLHLVRLAVLCTFFLLAPSESRAQAVEIVGSRALGLGGAFVAVASDSSATWWNPAGLGPGPFLDIAFAKALTQQGDTGEAWRATTSWLTFATPPIGVSYYRFRITDIQPSGSTGNDGGDREDSGAGVLVRSLSASQLGVTVLRTIANGVHTGTTLKYVRAAPSVASGEAARSVSDLLDDGDALDGGGADGEFDLDLGIIAVAGALRLGAVARNLREPEFDGVTLPRQYRVGVAIDPEPVGGVPLTVAFDADVRRYAAAGTDRRVVAGGAEYWLLEKRLGLRGGARLNTVGRREHTLSAGASVAPRAGLFIEGHVARGGSDDDEGWSVTARISF